MWFWIQSTGKLFHDDEFIAVGYSGHRTGKNNPELDHVRRVGPIPRGIWNLTGVYNSRRVGPFTIICDPERNTVTHGRKYFRIHGDSRRNPGAASRGCIILPRKVRELIWGSKDRVLKVVK